MTTLQRTTTVLTLANFALLAYGLAPFRPVTAQEVAPLVRAQALEIVDAQGRVRAEIKVLPAQPAVAMPDGTTGYPEAVQLRLISSQNNPNVKLVATEDGSGLVLSGLKGHTQLLSRQADPTIAIVARDGTRRTFGPR